MENFIGTSGWSYEWNLGKDLRWYLENSKLNAVELNSTFYKFPYPNMIKSWTEKSESFDVRWSIKVNRSITHSYKLSGRAETSWTRLEKLFKPLDHRIDFYLFQLHPMITIESLDRIEKFFKKTKLEERFALEIRHMSFFENIEKLQNIGLTFVSIDSPQFPKNIYNFSNRVYLRMHGRKLWYSHNYSKEELDDVAKRIKESNPKKAYIFFNNNHDMLGNAIMMKDILEK